MATNYGYGYLPKIVRFGDGNSSRGTISMTGKSSEAIYLGSFVPMATGSDASPSGAELGIPAFTDDSTIIGFVVGFTRNGFTVPIQDDDLRAGTVTDATGFLPMKYTFGAANDDASTTSAVREQVVIMPVQPGDILKVALWGASTSPVARGTTTAAGTTLSSDNMGVALPVNATYPWSLLEASAAKLLANMDFVTVEVDGKKPNSKYFVYVQCVRKFSSLTVPE